MELNLSDIEAELQENGLYSVTKFKIDGCKICSQTPENQNTTFSSRYGLLPQR
jgi:hypothetical protein